MWRCSYFPHILSVSSVLLSNRMPLWSSWLGHTCLRACSKMIQRQIFSHLCLEWQICFEHILSGVLIMTHNLGRSLLQFLNPTFTFEQQIAELCKQLFQIGLDEHKRREEEVSSFFSGHAKSVRYYQQKTSQILASFEEQHNEVRQISQSYAQPIYTVNLVLV